MDKRYDTYCAVDPIFYDRLSAAPGDQFAPATRPVPPGWRRRAHGDWLMHAPVGGTLPEQGWKIHVSACTANAERVLETCWRYCVDHRVAFKFLRAAHILLMRNAKYAPRGSSGKLVTVYPADETALCTVLTDLDERLGGEPGPYILSDLRWRNGPVYVRYGAFSRRYCLSERAELVPALADPDGVLVPDRRDPVFAVPDWVRLPDFLADQLAARNATTLSDLPYRVEKVLHFSNGGGIYRATDARTGDTVVLKEARPHAGLDATGDDAVTRLDREHRMLERLAGIGGVPAVVDRHTVGEHHFLVLEYVAGTPLNTELARRCPLADAGADAAGHAEYADWAVHVYRQVETVVRRIHERGVVYGDLHLFNIVVRADDTVCLLDFEVAADQGERRVPPLRNQAFAAPPGRTGAALDEYALACLRLALFLPLTALLRLYPAKAAHLAAVVAERFPLPDGFLDHAVHTITGAPPTGSRTRPGAARTAAVDGTEFLGRATDPDRWPRVRDGLARAILASATPERDDRLFPGDIAQFDGGGLGIAHGAAGVLYALSVTGAGRYPEHERWLVEHALRPTPGERPGLYDGLHGVAHVLEHLGHRQAALDVLERGLADDWRDLGLDLSGGLAGIGLNLAWLAERTGEPGLALTAAQVADRVAERLTAAGPVAETSGGRHPYAGLLHGRSGAALLLLDRYDRCGERRYLDLAAAALADDLRRCTCRPDGSLVVDEGWRTMPYLAAGSAGIGLGLAAYLDRCHDTRFAEAARQIGRAARSPLYVQSGLFAGRAGIVLYLAGTADRGAPAVPDRPRLLRRQLRALSWHALPYGGGIAFPGEQLLRLSMDLATGTAGVLLAVGSACHTGPVGLPGLPGRPAATPRVPARAARVGPTTNVGNMKEGVRHGTA